MVTPLSEGDPRQIGALAIEARLGEGASAVVYLGRAPGGDYVAVKVLHKYLAASPAVRDLLRQEAAALERVHGSRVARVLEVAIDEFPPYLIVEYVPGESLAESVSRAPLTGALLASMLDGVAEALEEIHAAGIVHRDLKPSNVIFGHDGVRVVDFGISAAVEVRGTASTAEFIGTPGWLSPEQAAGAPVTPASDLFNFGMLIAMASTGRNPFGEGRPDAMLYRVVNEQPDLRAVPSHLRELAAECLSKDPHSRPSVLEVRTRLAQFAGTSGGGTEGRSSETIVASATALERAARADTGRDPGAEGLMHRRKLRWPVVVGAAVLAVVLAGTGAVVANAIAPFGGPIKFAFVDSTSGNKYVNRPTMRVEVDNGDGKELQVPTGSGVIDVGSWHTDSSITVAFEPTFKNDERFERTWTARELGLNLLAVRSPVWISLNMADDWVALEVFGDVFWRNDGGTDVVSLGRANEESYRADQTIQYNSCVSNVTATWQNGLASYLKTNDAYTTALSDNSFSQGGTADLTVWSKRATGIADDLFIYESKVISAKTASGSLNPPLPDDVKTAMDGVWGALENSITAWDTYASALGAREYHPAGTLPDLFPREDSLVETARVALSNQVNGLVAAIPAGARVECDAQYPDRAK